MSGWEVSLVAWLGAASVSAVILAVLYQLFRYALAHPADRYLALRASWVLVASLPLALLFVVPPVQGAANWVGATARDAIAAPPAIARVGGAAWAGGIGRALLLLYLLGVVFLLLRWMRDRLALARLLHGARRAPGERLPVFLVDAAVGPMTVGILSPRIVVAAGHFARLSDHERDMVLCHEALHLGRRDPFWNGARRLLSGLLFFHPAVRWLSGRFEEEMELSVDSAVLADGRFSARAYGSLLVATAGQQGATRLAGTNLAKPFIHRRILNMKRSPVSRRPWLAFLVWLCFLGSAIPAVRAAGLAPSPADGVRLYLLDEDAPAGTWHGSPLVEPQDFATASLATPCDTHCTLGLELKPEAARRFEQFTAGHLGRRIGLVHRGKLLSASRLKAKIVSPRFELGGDLPRDEAQAVVREIVGR